MKSKIGVSSACYYPLETEKSLIKLGEAGFKNVELFLNSPSEIEDDFIKKLIDIKNQYDLNIVSVHPFQSFAESFYLFSNYERRYIDAFPLYKRLFDVTHMLGAEFFVFHGLKKPGSISDELYCERFAQMIEAGKASGITVCHENVVYHRGESPSYLKMMRDAIGEDFKVVFDIKQARKAGYTEDDFIPVIGDSIVHVHISDYNEYKVCITPLKGNMDFVSFFNKFNNLGYKGKFIIELYDWSYENELEIIEAYHNLTKIAEKI